jgi:hypothetical protein
LIQYFNFCWYILCTPSQISFIILDGYADVHFNPKDRSTPRWDLHGDKFKHPDGYIRKHHSRKQNFEIFPALNHRMANGVPRKDPALYDNWQEHKRVHVEQEVRLFSSSFNDVRCLTISIKIILVFTYFSMFFFFISFLETTQEGTE